MLNLTCRKRHSINRDTIASGLAACGMLEEKRRYQIDIGTGRYSKLQYWYQTKLDNASVSNNSGTDCSHGPHSDLETGHDIN